MELKREPLPRRLPHPPVAGPRHAAGDLEDEDLERYVEERVVTTTMDRRSRGRAATRSSADLWARGCCAIEMITDRRRAARQSPASGFEAFRASPRQSDLIILSGRVSIKMRR